jgi:hypothetical protein
LPRIVTGAVAVGGATSEASVPIAPARRGAVAGAVHALLKRRRDVDENPLRHRAQPVVPHAGMRRSGRPAARAGVSPARFDPAA